MENLLGQSAQCDSGPRGIAIDPASGEMANFSYVGISDDNLVFRRVSGSSYGIASPPEWTDPSKYRNDIEDVLEFSRISTLNEVEGYAAAHGPLFGPRFSSNGISREPVEAWFFAAWVMSLAFEFAAAASKPGGWRILHSNKRVGFDFELVPSPRDKKRLATGKAIGYDASRSCWSVRASCKFTRNIPDIYQWFVLGDQYDSGIWTSRKFDGTAEEWREFQARRIGEWAAFDETDQDRRESLFEMLPGISAGIVFNDTVDGTLGESGRQVPVTIRQPLEEHPELAEELGGKLCRLLYETLVSAHVRNVTYGWISHEFGPIFEEHLRRMWYTVSTYADKKCIAFCQHCGAPYIRATNRPRKYCSTSCNKAASKARRKRQGYAQ